MEEQKSSIEMVFELLNAGKETPVLTREQYKQAEKEINAKMEVYAIEQRAYFNQSIQSASTAYLTF